MGVVLYTLLVGSELGPWMWFPAYLADTPWDEPSDNSPEFAAYLSGELQKYDPWTRIRGQAKGSSYAQLRLSRR